MDTLLIWTTHHYKQFTLSLGKESPYIFSKFNLLNMDSLLILSFSMSLSVSVLRELDCSIIDFSLIYKPTFLRI